MGESWNGYGAGAFNYPVLDGPVQIPTGRWRAAMRTAKLSHRLRLQSFTQEAIQAAVIRIMSQDGAPGLTMDRVAAEVGMAKASLYVYFENKNQLLESVREASMQPLDAQLAALLEGDLPPYEKVRRLLVHLLSYFDRQPGLFRVLLWDHHLAARRARGKRSPRYQRFVSKLAKVLEEGVHTGAFKPLDPAKVAPLLLEAAVTIVGERVRRGETDSVEHDARLLEEVLLRGLAVRIEASP